MLKWLLVDHTKLSVDVAGKHRICNITHAIVVLKSTEIYSVAFEEVTETEVKYQHLTTIITVTSWSQCWSPIDLDRVARATTDVIAYKSIATSANRFNAICSSTNFWIITTRQHLIYCNYMHKEPILQSLSDHGRVVFSDNQPDPIWTQGGLQVRNNSQISPKIKKK